MQEIKVVTFCDYPGCADASREESPNGQEVLAVDFWVYATRRGGRKSKPIQVELCEEHAAELRDLYIRMQKTTSKGGFREVLEED